MAKILVVDDEAGIRDIIKEYLQFEGYEYNEAANGMEALDILKKEDFDLVVLDIMMPKLDGVTVLKEMRKTKATPVIMLTARGEEYDKLFGFELGADDYVVKPFSPRELMARIKSILKRVSAEQASPVVNQLIFDQLVIDVAARDIYIDGEKLNVTPKEFDLLLYLCRNKNIVLSRNQILAEVWGYDFFGDDRTVDTHIKMLRSSMGRYRDVIKTVWGIGYKFEL
ncbi:MAG: response regulator transcription factor [Clostridia bacterium]|nr:response regulator transcription factor [Clostridia bacterium]